MSVRILFKDRIPDGTAMVAEKSYWSATRYEWDPGYVRVYKEDELVAEFVATNVVGVEKP